MLSGDREASLLFTTCPERENNRSHGTAVAGEAKYLKVAWQQGHAMAHISATIPMDTIVNFCSIMC